VKTGAFSSFRVSGYPGNFLLAGQSVFGIDSTAGATWMGAKAPHADIADEKRVSYETAVMAIPQIDPDNPLMISQGPSVCIFNKEDPQEVLASWIFAQYLLSNGVQIAYAQTEGYVPVTVDAQSDPAYLDYLSRAGEDDDFYYDVKIEATKLLLAHIDDTFVTPVFNGSASLRDAAGMLIDTTVKSTNRKQEVNDAYLDNLFAEMRSLYRLDQAGATGQRDLGPFPKTAKILLISLAAAWSMIAVYGSFSVLRAKILK